MPTCKECIHKLVCAIYIPELIDIFENGEYCTGYMNEANVVEVVRCKDCTYGRYDGDGYWICELDDCYVDDTYYCSCGERKE